MFLGLLKLFLGFSLYLESVPLLFLLKSKCSHLQKMIHYYPLTKGASMAEIKTWHL